MEWLSGQNRILRREFRIIVHVSLVPFFPNDTIASSMPWYPGTEEDQILRFVEWTKKTMFPKRKPQTRLVINLVLAWQFSRRAIPRGPRGFLSWRLLLSQNFDSGSWKFRRNCLRFPRNHLSVTRIFRRGSPRYSQAIFIPDRDDGRKWTRFYRNCSKYVLRYFIN